MRLIVEPVSFIAMNVNNTESGIEIPITNVERPSFKNKKITATAIRTPRIPDPRTFESEFLTDFESSEKILQVKAPSVSEAIPSRTLLICLQIFTVFPEALFETVTMITLLLSSIMRTSCFL